MKIVAFGHRKLSGKNTAARFLCTYLRTTHKGKLNIRSAGFADKLKDVCFQLYSWAGMQQPEYYEQHPERKTDFLSELGMTVREVWIRVGNRMREAYEDTWIKYLLNVKCDLLIIYDLRYPNEFNQIKDKGGICIRIKRPWLADTDDEADRALENWDKWDDTFVSDENDFRGLHASVEKLGASLIGSF